MTIEQAKFLERVTTYQGNQECEIREGYSGRGMYGSTTVGFVVDSLPQLLVDVLNYYNDGCGQSETFEGFNTDNMGRSMILY